MTADADAGKSRTVAETGSASDDDRLFVAVVAIREEAAVPTCRAVEPRTNLICPPPDATTQPMLELIFASTALAALVGVMLMVNPVVIAGAIIPH